MAKVKIEEKVEGKVCRGKGQNNGEAGGREARRESNGKSQVGCHCEREILSGPSEGNSELPQIGNF